MLDDPTRLTPRRLTAVAGAALDHLWELRVVLGQLQYALLGLPPTEVVEHRTCPADLASILEALEAEAADLLAKVAAVRRRM